MDRNCVLRMIAPAMIYSLNRRLVRDVLVLSDLHKDFGERVEGGIVRTGSTEADDTELTLGAGRNRSCIQCLGRLAGRRIRGTCNQVGLGADDRLDVGSATGSHL